MTSNEIIELIKDRRDRASAGSTDTERAVVRELNEILGTIEMAGVLTGSDQPDGNMRPHQHMQPR
jgi:hypothetical protein